MEFTLSLIFLLLYYLRPQDWVPGLAGANLVKPIMAIWLLVLITNRSRPSTFPGILRTPHDWVMLTYFIYVTFTAPDFQTAFMGFLPGVMFYALTVQSVNGWDRAFRYLKWWNGALVGVALFGVLALHGIDFTGARENYFTLMGRLALGTWLHNNPNALGHTVVVIIPLSYVLYFWKGSVTGRLLIFPLLAGLASYCAWHTQSKGAFLVGGLLVVLIFVIGRPRMVQIFSLALALTVGVSALSFLPRMSEMGNLRADEGVQGRLLAWEMARTVTRNDATGQGWNTFEAYVPWREGRHFTIVRMATHSSYVQIGAELGRYGLFLYLAGIWCALHTLVIIRSRNDMEERCRRGVFLLVAGYVASGWMINREYHTEYFLIVALAAALHRLFKGEELAAPVERDEMENESPGTMNAPPPAGKDPPPSVPVPAPAFTSRVGGTLQRLRPLWNRFGAIDFAASAGITWLTFWTWDYILTNL